jgi:hypothetical protein
MAKTATLPTDFFLKKTTQNIRKKMDNLKKILGIVWILMGIAAGYYLIVNQALEMWKLGLYDVAKIEKLVLAIIYTFILTPIIVSGMIYFGIYCLQNEYKKEDPNKLSI